MAAFDLKEVTSGMTPQEIGDAIKLAVTSQQKSGSITASRPASPDNYQFHFDTTLNKPIWYNGSAWVDATGATV